jgi:transposase
MISSPEAANYQHFVGIDVAAATATACEWAGAGRAGTPFTFSQTEEGYTCLVQRLQSQPLPAERILIVLEATGAYWLRLACHLVQQGYAVSVINPAQAHHFAKALLQRAKSDELDAQVLAELAARLQPARWTPPPALYAELQQVRNQQHALHQHPVVVEAVHQRLHDLLATLDAQIQQIEREVHAVRQQDSAWAAAAARLQSITGVGLITTGWLLVATLAFSACATPEAATAYAGLAPRLRQSGSSVRGRPSSGHNGHARLRTALYLATLRATRFNPVIRHFYARLRAAGKPVKVARCAAARKLLHIAWALVTKDQDFDPYFGQSVPAQALRA